MWATAWLQGSRGEGGADLDPHDAWNVVNVCARIMVSSSLSGGLGADAENRIDSAAQQLVSDVTSFFSEVHSTSG